MVDYHSEAVLMHMPILNNKFAPITFKFGFLRAGIDETVKEYVHWQHMILRAVSKNRVDGGLERKLQSILPLDDDGSRILFSTTKSEWVAVFDNAVTGGQAGNAVAIISEKLTTVGLTFTEIPNTFSKSNPKESPGKWGALALNSFGLKRSTGIWGVTRSVSLRNDVSGWQFQQIGTPWDFENLARYESRNTKERLDSELLTMYLEQFGIRINDEGFYEGSGVATQSRFLLRLKLKTFDIAAVQKQMRIPT